LIDAFTTMCNSCIHGLVSFKLFFLSFSVPFSFGSLAEMWSIGDLTWLGFFSTAGTLVFFAIFLTFVYKWYLSYSKAYRVVSLIQKFYQLLAGIGILALTTLLWKAYNNLLIHCSMARKEEEENCAGTRREARADLIHYVGKGTVFLMWVNSTLSLLTKHCDVEALRKDTQSLSCVWGMFKSIVGFSNGPKFENPGYTPVKFVRQVHKPRCRFVPKNDYCGKCGDHANLHPQVLDCGTTEEGFLEGADKCPDCFRSVMDHPCYFLNEDGSPIPTREGKTQNNQAPDWRC